MVADTSFLLVVMPAAEGSDDTLARVYHPTK
jgi:hypothetical protein